MYDRHMTNPTPTTPRRTITRAEYSTWTAALLALILTFLNWTGVTVEDPSPVTQPTPTASASPSPSPSSTISIPPVPTVQPSDPITAPPTPAPISTKPDAINTGPKPGLALATINGNYTMATDGEKLSAKNITGTLILAANNITVTDVKANGIFIQGKPGPDAPLKSNMTLIRVESPDLNNQGLKNVTIKASHFTGRSGTQTSQIAYWKCVKGTDGQCTAASGLVRENNDGLTITDSLFDGAKPTTLTKHLEALHLIGATNVVLRNNVFDYLPPDLLTWRTTTAAFTMEGGPWCTDVIIDGNWFYGGGYYQVYIFGERVTVTNNKFHSWQVAGAPAPAGIQYPPSAYGRWFPLLGNTGNTLDGKPFALTNPAAR